MRQATLDEFGFQVKTVYIPIRNFPYKTRSGLSETQLRKRLEMQGWLVWRGNFVWATQGDSYPRVQKRYDQLRGLILELFGEPAYESLRYMCQVHHGMPDLVCYHSHLREFKFVECKLGHEQLSSRQILTIQKLHQLGFLTEVHRLVDPCTKTREARVDLVFKKKHVLEKEMTIRAFRKTKKVSSVSLSRV